MPPRSGRRHGLIAVIWRVLIPPGWHCTGLTPMDLDPISLEGFDSCIGKIPQRREQLPTPVFLPGEFHGQRNLTGYSSWGWTQLGNFHLHFFHFVCLEQGLGIGVFKLFPSLPPPLHPPPGDSKGQPLRLGEEGAGAWGSSFSAHGCVGAC